MAKRSTKKKRTRARVTSTRKAKASAGKTRRARKGGKKAAPKPPAPPPSQTTPSVRRHKPKSRRPQPTPESTVAAAKSTGESVNVEAGDIILAWEDDPISLGAATQPVERRVPSLSSGTLRATMDVKAPATGKFGVDTPEFRYWATADALRRGLDFWGALVPTGTIFRPGKKIDLEVSIDEKIADFNAYYDPMTGLTFHQKQAGHAMIHSAESPDIVLHEFGHAVLDAVRPELYDAQLREVDAFHESFGDISALLVGMSHPTLGPEILRDTGGQLYSASRLSRIGEQLASGVRRGNPDRVAADCLRNAVNTWTYRDMSELPIDGPDGTLTRRPHSFSRVFTGGFFEAIGNMLAVINPTSPSPKDLADVAAIAGKLVLDAVRAVDLREVAFLPEITRRVMDSVVKDHPRFTEACGSAFVRRGLLTFERGSEYLRTSKEKKPARMAVINAGEDRPRWPDRGSSPPNQIISGLEVGLPVDRLQVPAHGARTGRFSMLGMAAEERPARSSEAAVVYLRDLIQRGRVEIPSPLRENVIGHNWTKKTHELRQEDGFWTIKRLRYDCCCFD